MPKTMPAATRNQVASNVIRVEQWDRCQPASVLEDLRRVSKASGANVVRFASAKKRLRARPKAMTAMGAILGELCDFIAEERDRKRLARLEVVA